MSDYACRICGGVNRQRQVVVKEMMYGIGEEFLYDQCADCGSLQIEPILPPEILSRHYPENYYSREPEQVQHRRGEFQTRLRHMLKSWRLTHDLGWPTLRGKIVNSFFPDLGEFLELKGTKIRYSDKILDVGCGAAANLLGKMSRFGFTNLAGADPFIDSDVTTKDNVVVYKKHVHELTEKFDFIMFHHSFEHVPLPAETLAAARACLEPGARCFIRIPTPSSEAFEIYGVNWPGLDAPRHMTAISRPGMTALAERCGFVVEWTRDDSTIFQFTASELSRRGIPFFPFDKVAGHFTKEQLSEYARRARELNAIQRGDQAGFMLRAV